MKSNKKEEQLKKHLTKEMDSINVPEGLKEELWKQMNATRKKRVFQSKILPYMVAIAAIVIFIPLVLSLLTTSELASNELSGKTFDIRVTGDPNFPGELTTIATLVFSDDNTFKNTRGNEQGTYELNDNKLSLLMGDENEMLEMEYTLEESDREVNAYAGELTDINYEMEDIEQISKYRNFSFGLSQYSFVIFSEK